jgi:serine/threonine-protein kinase Chk1
VPLDQDSPVFAVKLIHKGYAIQNGRLSAKQIAMEVSLHSHIGQHPNIIEWFATDEDPIWRWIAMEYAEGGDLFDKIEADVGVPEEIAHLYFLQLIGGVSFMHSKGVAHRDLKPENILLSASGNLKLADFGMATLFEHKGQRKMSATMCGSPPYIAPEVLDAARADRRNPQQASKYSADLVDIWSCGVVLFVLLVGNTPWDEPTSGSWEFGEYVRTNGRSTDALWERIPSAALSLLRGMMNVDPKRRFSFAQIRQHPWYTQHNNLLTADGTVSDPIHLATQMMKNLHIDLSQAPTPSQKQALAEAEAMDVDFGSDRWAAKFSATQPEVPITDVLFDWERPALRTIGAFEMSSTQPVQRRGGGGPSASRANRGRAEAYDMLAEEPSMSQFSSTPGVPLSLTQRARQFRDIVPAYSLTRFFSHIPPGLLVQKLSDALHQLNVPLPAPPAAAAATKADQIAPLRFKALDGRGQSLHGDIIIDKIMLEGDHELLEVRFVKTKGDPLEWRRLFKKIALLCKDAIFNSDA